MRQKKIPMRMCTGCGEMKPKKELVRVVKAPRYFGGPDGPQTGAGRVRLPECGMPAAGEKGPPTGKGILL